MKWYYWFLGIPIGSAIIFGIVQPFVWRLKFGDAPPGGTVSLSILLTVVVALLALGVSAFGLLAYSVLQHRLRESLECDIVDKANIALARAQGSVAYNCWRTWLLGRRLGYLDYQSICSAISNQTDALGLIDAMKREEYEELPETVKESINQQKSNLAGYITYNLRFQRDKMSQAEVADQIRVGRKYGKEAYDEATRFGEKYDWKANYAGLLMVIGTEREKNDTAQPIISELEQRYSKGEISCEEMDEYRELFHE